MQGDDDEAIVRSVVSRVAASLGLSHALDDLAGAARLGVVEARTRFDPSRGVKFSTFAYYRARGAVFDHLRRSSYLSRRAYRRMVADQAVDGVAEAVGETRTADPGSRTDVAATVASLDETVQQMTASIVLSCLGQDREADEEDAEQRYVEQESRALVLAAVRSLPDRERALVEGHYFQGRDFDEVAGELGISKSWASRIHTKALVTLRKRLAALDR